MWGYRTGRERERGRDRREIKNRVKRVRDSNRKNKTGAKEREQSVRARERERVSERESVRGTLEIGYVRRERRRTKGAERNGR